MEKVLTRYDNHATLPEIAKVVSNAFPELERRALAVAGVDASFGAEQKAIKPPYALIGFAEGTGDGPVMLGQSMSVDLVDEFVIEMVMKPEKYKSQAGETPLWAYYDFEIIRDRLFAALHNYGSEREIGFQFMSMTPNIDQNGVYIEFIFRQNYEWCEPEDSSDEGETVRLSVNMTNRC